VFLDVTGSATLLTELLLRSQHCLLEPPQAPHGVPSKPVFTYVSLV